MTHISTSSITYFDKLNNMEDNYQLITKTAAGLEEVLAREIKALGAKNVRLMHRAVICEGNKELMYRINYEVRTALKVLKPFKNFFAKNPDELYKKLHPFAICCLDSKGCHRRSVP